MRKLLIATVASLLVACSGASAKPTPAAQEAEGPRAVLLDASASERLGITTVVAGDEVSPTQLSVPASIEFDITRYAEVGARLEGRIHAVHAQLGDKVKKGAPLATMMVPTLGDAQADVIQAKAGHAAAKKNADRERELLEKKLTTAKEFELAESELARAEAEVAAAEARLAALGASPGIGGTFVLRAPIEGVVVKRDAIVGGFSSATQSAFAVADPTVMTAILDVHESDLPHVQVGNEVSLEVGALGERTFRGKVFFIDPNVDKNTRLVRARVSVENGDGALRAGMSARGKIAVAKVRTAHLLLPADAVQTLGDESVVFVQTDPGKFAVRPVTVARRTAAIVEVSEGVSRGERIVAKGAFLLRAEAGKQ
jgi:cobalt-zinc-cadmium efflux system membrane fusion protein